MERSEVWFSEVVVRHFILAQQRQLNKATTFVAYWYLASFIHVGAFVWRVLDRFLKQYRIGILL